MNRQMNLSFSQNKPRKSEFRSLPKKDVKGFDIRYSSMPRKVKDSLLHCHAAFCESLIDSLNAYVSLPVHAALKSIVQMTYADYQETVKQSSVFYLFDIHPACSQGLLRLDSPLVVTAIDRVLGGDGKKAKGKNSLSLIEMKMAEAFMSQILNQINMMWERFGEFTFTGKTSAQSGTGVDFMRADESLLMACFVLGLGDVAGYMDVCLPYSLIKPILSAIEKYNESSFGDLEDPKIATILKSKMENIHIPLKVSLCEFEMSLKKLMGLKSGDVIRIYDLNKEITVKTDGTSIFSGQAGVFNDKFAVQIHSLVPLKK